jgi:hypothetical protein
MRTLKWLLRQCKSLFFYISGFVLSVVVLGTVVFVALIVWSYFFRDSNHDREIELGERRSDPRNRDNASPVPKLIYDYIQEGDRFVLSRHYRDASESYESAKRLALRLDVKRGNEKHSIYSDALMVIENRILLAGIIFETDSQVNMSTKNPFMDPKQ